MNKKKRIKVLFILEIKNILKLSKILNADKDTGWLKTYLFSLKNEFKKNGVDVHIDNLKKPDIIDIHIPGYNCLKYLVNKKTPIILHGHISPESFQFNNLSFITKIFYKYWLKILCKRVDLIIAPSKYAKNEFEKICDCKIQVISNGVNLERFCYSSKKRDKFREKYRIKKDEFVLLSVGRIDKRKGFDQLCEIMKTIPNIRLVVCGREKKKFDFSNNAIFTGFIDDIESAYCGADAYISLSKQETQGLTILEAAACKLPLILSDLPVFKEWLTPDVDCIISNNSNVITKSIMKLKNKPKKRKQLANNAYYKVKSYHNIKECSKKVIKEYYHILNKQKSN
ncbi:MAG: glycosyltransferase family 4 protein [Nanoarchaeota archaeon]|nr:glycosyltransferase family 4 protein [Nanoarchaeota archaeon]